ncbi:MAG: phenylacetate--CoA ligase family protein [Candidatus Lokiarchaeia archaeon]
MVERKYYSEAETLPREKLLKLQEEKLKKAIKYAYENSKFYHKKFDEAGIRPEDIKTLDDFYKKVPFTSKPELVRSQRENPPYGGIIAVPPEKLKMLFISPGPIFEPYTDNDIKVVGRSTAKVMYRAGVRPDDVAQITATYHFMPAGFAFHFGAQEVGCMVIPAGPGESRMQVDFMKKVGTTVIGGFPSFLAKLGAEAIKLGVDPKKDLNLRIGVCGGEPLPPSLRKNIEETFGIDLFEGYGVAELGIIASECEKHSGMHVNEEFFLMEIIDPNTLERVEPGEEGEIVCTPLEREALPLIRYRTGDGSVLIEETCECGRTEARIPRIMGRVDMITKVKGVFIHPKQAEEVVKNYPELGRFQIIVERPGIIDEMTIKVECEDSSKFEEFKKILEADFKQALRIKTNVEVVNPGEIPTEAKRLEDRREFV